MGQQCSLQRCPPCRIAATRGRGAKTQEDKTNEFEKKYKIGQNLAPKVFVVKHKISQALYAVYRLRKDTIPCRDSEAFAFAVRRLQALDHHNICHLIEALDDDPRYTYLVYSKVDGLPIFDKIIRDGGLCEQGIANVARQAVRALSVAEEIGVCHGALLPKNMFLSNNGHLEITDFGLAGILKPVPLETTPDSSMAFMAPEVVSPWLEEFRSHFAPQAHEVTLRRDEGIVTPESDLWSMGAILFTLLCGKLPFPGDLPNGQLAENICSLRISFCAEIEHLHSSETLDFLHRLLQKDPVARSSAAKLLQHSWLRPRRPTQELSASLHVCRHLRTIHAESHAKKALMRMISAQIPRHKIREIEEVFHEMDYNKDGRISLQEFRDGLARHPELAGRLGREGSLFSEIDVDSNGTISFREFLAATLDSQAVLVDQVLWDTFRALDVDRNGTVSPEELKAGIREIDGRLGEEHVEIIVQRLEDEVQEPMTFSQFKALLMEEGGRHRRQSEYPSWCGARCMRVVKQTSDVTYVSSSQGATCSHRASSKESTQCPSSSSGSPQRSPKESVRSPHSSPRGTSSTRLSSKSRPSKKYDRSSTCPVNVGVAEDAALDSPRPEAHIVKKNSLAGVQASSSPNGSPRPRRQTRRSTVPASSSPGSSRKKSK